MATKTEDTAAATAATEAAAAAAASPADQSFDDAFAEITANEDLKPKPAETKDKPAEAPDATTTATAPAPSDADAAATAAAEAAAATAPSPELTAALARIAELEKTTKPADTSTTDDDDDAAAVAAAAAATAAAAAPIEWYKPSEQEAALLAQHAKDWPDIAAAQEVATKAAVYNAVQFVFAQIKKTYDPVLDRFGAVSEALESELALTDLRRSHSDYDTVRDAMVKWVDTLPNYQKNGAKQVLVDGTPAEVAELVSEYKKANPTAAAATTAAVAVVPTVVKKTELTEAAKKAAGKLTVVESKRTNLSTGAADMQDFDAAWKEATATG